jgi:lipid-binding SYLF domain-containing protein
MNKPLITLMTAAALSVAPFSGIAHQAKAAMVSSEQDPSRPTASTANQLKPAPIRALEANAEKALKALYDSSPSAAAMGKEAKAVLVFPDVKKMGFMAAVSFGEGVLFKDGHVANYYSTKSGSWGFQAGHQRFGYALFFMSDEAVNYLDHSRGWEIGAGPSVVVADRGIARKVSTTTVNHDVHAIIFNQRGLMAGVGVEGSKITLLKW